jgi:hypothetical protein
LNKREKEKNLEEGGGSIVEKEQEIQDLNDLKRDRKRLLMILFQKRIKHFWCRVSFESMKYYLEIRKRK